MKRLSDYAKPADAQAAAASGARTATTELYRSNWEVAYADWRTGLLADTTKPPYDQQWEILDLVHKRCVFEHREEVNHCVNADASEEPLFRLIHGLPGSGKSQVLKWLRSYFEGSGRALRVPCAAEQHGGQHPGYDHPLVGANPVCG